MNKFLMLSAAAVLSSFTAAQAEGVYCFGFGTSGGNPYCDGGRIYTGVDGGAFDGSVRAWQHVNNNCSSGVSSGFGLLSKTPGLRKASMMSDNFSQNYGTTLAYLLPAKIKDGKPWQLWIGLDGTFFEGGSGVLIDVTKCGKAAKANGRKSTLASVRELIRVHRNANMSPPAK